MKTAPIDRPLDNTAGTTMKAIVQDNYGDHPGEVLRLAEVPRPTIGDGQVLVRVAAASIDRGTVHVMTGLPFAMRFAGFGVRAPKALNPGRCLAGTVELVGKDVTGFAPGDEVYGTCTGSFAEYAVAKPGRLAPKPANLSFEQAAAAPISGVTALQAVRDQAKVEADQKVLVIGASGGVGSFAVQIAKAFGAEVTGVSSTSKMDLVRGLGADHVVDYTEGDFLSGKVRYDVILDTGGNSPLPALRRALTATGTLVLVGGETEGWALLGMGRQIRALLQSATTKQKLAMLVSKENSEDLIALSKLMESGKVAPAVDRTYPLAETAAAIGYVHEGRARGKVVITV
jgi:NADPH:quinone reductase-like Zn-dependent oxidoreductase